MAMPEQYSQINWNSTFTPQAASSIYHASSAFQAWHPSSFKADVARKTSRSGLCFAGQKIRVVGSGLSPNGMAFSSQGMLSTVLLDDIISVDKEKQQVTVQAGARVQQVHLALTTVMDGVLHHTHSGRSEPTKSPNSR